MPARRKNWLLPARKSSIKKLPAPSPASLLAYPSYAPTPTFPRWALSLLVTALLGRDNRKILPTRAELLLNKLQEFSLLVEAVEANGVELKSEMKEKLVAWFVQDMLTAKPRAHSRETLLIHSHIVDQFLQSKGWPMTKTTDIGNYKQALVMDLPMLFEEMSRHRTCGPRCPAKIPTESEIKHQFWMLGTSPKLRDRIVSFHHGIEPASLRDLRSKDRIRRIKPRR